VRALNEGQDVLKNVWGKCFILLGQSFYRDQT